MGKNSVEKPPDATRKNIEGVRERQLLVDCENKRW
jgi:hypothetical protein